MHTNHVELTGTVHGDAWTSYHRSQGRVNFWLAVPRAPGAAEVDLFRCAIYLRTPDEIWSLEHALSTSRPIRIGATARSLVGEDTKSFVFGATPGVIFVAGEWSLDPEPPPAPAARRVHPTGKLAAAHDYPEPAAA